MVVLVLIPTKDLVHDLVLVLIVDGHGGLVLALLVVCLLILLTLSVRFGYTTGSF